jgi:5'-3' exonuclease
MKSTLLIDGDLVAYRVSAATQTTYDLPDVGEVVSARLDQAIEAAIEIVDGYVTDLGADTAVVCLSDDLKNFRHTVAASYKGNRKGSRPVNLYEVKEALAERFKFLRWPRLEADDVMGIVSTQPKPDGRLCIVSADKDLAGIPGWLFNPMKDKKPRKVSELDANRWWLTQALIGDPVDGYPGCRGIGPRSPFVAAVNEATDLRTMWDAVVAGFASKGMTEDDALVQARLARILRHGEYDKATYDVCLWTPPTH